MIWLCGHFQGSLWVNAPELTPPTSSSSPHTSGMPTYLPTEPMSLMKTKHFSFLNLFSLLFFFWRLICSFQNKRIADILHQNSGYHHISDNSLTMWYGKPLKIVTAVVGSQCARIMKNNSAVPHALLVVFVINELWRFGVNDPYHIELSFFIADN